MSNNIQIGKQGEKDIIRKVFCPNCNKKLMLLPPNYPLFDIQCTGCYFRAQIKTSKSKPKTIVFGAGWRIMEKVLKAGFAIPPLFVNFKWKENKKTKQEIRFYPFVPRKNLRKHKLSARAKRANHWVFNYTGLDKLPYFVVCEK